MKRFNIRKNLHRSLASAYLSNQSLQEIVLLSKNVHIHTNYTTTMEAVLGTLLPGKPVLKHFETIA